MIYNGEKYITVSAIAGRWGCAQQTVLRYIKRGLIPGAFKHNSRWYVPAKTEMPVFDRMQPGPKTGKAKPRRASTSETYDTWLNRIDEKRWSKLFLEV